MVPVFGIMCSAWIHIPQMRLTARVGEENSLPRSRSLQGKQRMKSGIIAVWLRLMVEVFPTTPVTEVPGCH